jgi:hypothetical protein
MVDFEEESPAAKHNVIPYYWLSESKSNIITHQEEKHRIVSSNVPLPENYTATLLIKKCENPAYCMFGLTDKIINLRERSYLGNNELGVVGFCFSSVTACEDNWVWHRTEANQGDIIKIVGDKRDVQIYTNDVQVQNLSLLKNYDNLYLACHLYGLCEFEIIDVKSIAEFEEKVEKISK